MADIHDESAGAGASQSSDLPFWLLVARRPVSQQASAESKRRYRQALSDAARTIERRDWNRAGAALRLRIIWFHGESAGQDVDNIIKPISDALAPIAYEDDRVLVQCEVERVDTRKDFELMDRGRDPSVHRRLVSLLSSDHKHLLYIEVEPVRARAILIG